MKKKYKDVQFFVDDNTLWISGTWVRAVYVILDRPYDEMSVGYRSSRAHSMLAYRKPTSADLFIALDYLGREAFYTIKRAHYALEALNEYMEGGR